MQVWVWGRCLTWYLYPYPSDPYLHTHAGFQTCDEHYAQHPQPYGLSLLAANHPMHPPHFIPPLPPCPPWSVPELSRGKGTQKDWGNVGCIRAAAPAPATSAKCHFSWNPWKSFFKKKMVFRAFRVDLDQHFFFQNLVCIALIAFEAF